MYLGSILLVVPANLVLKNALFALEVQQPIVQIANQITTLIKILAHVILLIYIV